MKKLIDFLIAFMLITIGFFLLPDWGKGIFLIIGGSGWVMVIKYFQ